MDFKLYNVALGIMIFGFMSVLLVLVDIGRMYYKVQSAAGDLKKIEKAIDRFKWQTYTVTGTFVVYTLTVMWKSGFPLW